MGAVGSAAMSTAKRTVEDQLEAELIELIDQRRELDREIKRREGALDALRGAPIAPRRSSPTARASILAALSTFRAPVHTSALLDHDLLVHYSRHTLRGALADLHRAGEIEGIRAPKGFIWKPASVNGQ